MKRRLSTPQILTMHLSSNLRDPPSAEAVGALLVLAREVDTWTAGAARGTRGHVDTSTTSGGTGRGGDLGGDLGSDLGSEISSAVACSEWREEEVAESFGALRSFIASADDQLHVTTGSARRRRLLHFAAGRLGLRHERTVRPKGVRVWRATAARGGADGGAGVVRGVCQSPDDVVCVPCEPEAGRQDARGYNT